MLEYTVFRALASQDAGLPSLLPFLPIFLLEGFELCLILICYSSLVELVDPYLIFDT